VGSAGAMGFANRSRCVHCAHARIAAQCSEPSSTAARAACIHLSVRPLFLSISQNSHSGSEIPPPVSGWPTPWLEPPEVEEYLFPLQRDSQWRVDFTHKANLSVPTLRKTFNFKGGISALAFMKDVLIITDSEEVSFPVVSCVSVD